MAWVGEETLEGQREHDPHECGAVKSVGAHLVLGEPRDEVVAGGVVEVDEGLLALELRGLHQERAAALEQGVHGGEAVVVEDADEEGADVDVFGAGAVAARQEPVGDRDHHRDKRVFGVLRRGGVFDAGVDGDDAFALARRERREREGAHKGASAVERAHDAADGVGGVDVDGAVVVARKRVRGAAHGATLPYSAVKRSAHRSAAERLAQGSAAERSAQRFAELSGGAAPRRADAFLVPRLHRERTVPEGPPEGMNFMSEAPSSPTPTLRPLLGLAVGALAVFLVELTLMRAVAQVTWPPFAFLALSAAMLGGGLAGTLLVLRPDWSRAPELPAAGGVVVAVGAPAAMVAVLLAGLEPLRVGVELQATVVFIAVLLALALPFVGLALSLSALLLEFSAHPHRVYGADLTGAAIGSFISVALLDGLGTAPAGALAGALGAVSALLLARGVALRAVGVAALVGGLAFLPAAKEIVPRPTADKRVGVDPARDVLALLKAHGQLHTVDGADGRVDVLPAKPAAAVLIDLGAAVTRAPVYPAKYAPRDAVSAGFLARSPAGGDVLIVGSGAGYEVAGALLHGAAHVDAVEVSAAVLAAAKDGSIPSSKAVYDDARVSAHLEEARSFLEQQDRKGEGKRWRHIVAAHTISNAAVTVNAMRLAEDFLLTRESLHTLLGHVSDDGVLYMTRPSSQIDLLADLARDALRAEGVVDVDAHIALLVRDVEDPFFRGLLVSKQALTISQLDAPGGHHWIAAPPPTGERLPTDERPFFHRQSDDVAHDASARLRIEGPALAESAVAWVGGLSVALSAFVIVLPLLFRRRGIDFTASVGAARVERRPALAHLVVACMLGLGFMCLELSLAQRLTLLCGRPAVAFAAVVGGMLLGAGLAGLAASRARVRLSLTVALALSALGAALSVFAPPLLDALGVLTLPPFLRAAIAATVAAVLSAPLGLGFPELVAVASRRSPSAAPWLYGLNATVSVGATALHAGIAPLFGLVGTTVIAAACYAIGAAVVAVHDRERQPQSA